MEKLVHAQKNEFFTDNKILYNYQSGFRINQSSNLSLSFLTNKILNDYGKGLLTEIILNDLQKAFHT